MWYNGSARKNRAQKQPKKRVWLKSKIKNEVWLSLVERYVRDVEVASSNLVTSTKIGFESNLKALFLCLQHRKF